MALPAPLHRYTYAEYVALEALSPVKHEFLQGDIYAMAGGTPEHAALAATVLRLIGNQLREGCRAYTSDLRVRMVGANVTTYPDGAVICGKTARAADDANAVTNPVLLVEITSDSTEKYDGGEKLALYQQLESLREVLFVSHRERRLTVHRRIGAEWTVVEAAEDATIALESVGARLEVASVYAAIE